MLLFFKSMAGKSRRAMPIASRPTQRRDYRRLKKNNKKRSFAFRQGSFFSFPRGGRTMKKHMSTLERMTRLFSVLLVVTILFGSAAFPTRVRADSIITVNSTADNTTTDGDCTLREAITNADSNMSVFADCAPGSGNDTIQFSVSGTITLASLLPYIQDSAGLTIEGGDALITISGNDSVQVFSVGSGALFTLESISVTHGYAGDGGGLYNDQGDVTIAYSTFSNNNATNSGGGVGSTNGTLTITNSTFLDNSAIGDGGGVTSLKGTLIIANSTFSGNFANYGGGVTNNSGTATIINSTFSGNSANANGGGVFTYNIVVPPTPPTTTIRNTIIANNIAVDDCWNHATGTLIGDHNIIMATSTCTSIATLTSDPNLGALTGSPSPVYFPLNIGSPAIDAGDDAVCAVAPINNQSQNGLPRPQGAHCDIGSYEGGFLLNPAYGAILPTNRPAFDWSDFTGATSYQIQVSGNTGFKPLALSKTTTGSSYIPTKNLSNGTLYYWRVRAKVGKVYGPWSPVWMFTTGNPPPIPVLSAPGNKKVVAGPSPLFDWKDVKIITGVTFNHYEIEITTDPSFETGVAPGASAISQYDGFTLTSGVTYYWRVRSVADNGDFSAWSKARIVTIL
jgi:CSLREA domain-containing protein